MNLQRYATCFLLLSGFLFSSCEKECSDTINKKFVAYNFHSITAGEDHRITLKEAADYSVKANGCEEDINELRVAVINGVLTIRYNDDYEKRELVKFIIEVPTFALLTLNDAAACTINGFSDSTEQHAFQLSGTASCSYTGNAAYLEADLNDDADMTVAGTILKSNIELSGNSKYDGRNTSGNLTTFIDASNASTGYVYALDTLTAEASGSSRIYYKGNPGVKNFTEIGQGKILPL